MDKFKVELVRHALKFYKKCPLELALRLNKCFEALEENPFFGTNIKVLKGEVKRYRYRVGDHRIIYIIDKESRKVAVILISPRASAYRDL